MAEIRIEDFVVRVPVVCRRDCETAIGETRGIRLRCGWDLIQIGILDEIESIGGCDSKQHAVFQ